MMNLNQENIDEHLLLQYLLGSAGAEEQRIVEEWLNESREHQARLDKLESVWIETGRISPVPVAVDPDAAWKRVSERITREEQVHSLHGKERIMPPRLIRYALSAAAVILLMIGIYSLYRMVTKPAELIELTSAGLVIHDTLPDGSRVTLNTNSKLIYPADFKDNKREVRLTGEGFFDVTYDADQPFIIDAGAARIKVLGTAFMISAYPERAIKVNVTKGRVLFFTVNSKTGDTSYVVLTAGKKGVLPLKSFIPVMVDSTAQDDLFWFDHSLEFNRTPLSRVFRLLERHYPVSIKVSDENINNCLLTASFADDPIDRILTVIAESFDLKVVSTNQTYLITGNGCAEGGK